jgi:hypothetical protein
MKIREIELCAKVYTSPNEASFFAQYGAAKLEHGAQAEDFRIREPLARKASKRVRRTEVSFWPFADIRRAALRRSSRNVGRRRPLRRQKA